MSEYIKIALKLIWGVLVIFWTVSSLNSKKVSSQEPLFERFVYYWLPFMVAILLLGPGPWFGHTLIRENFVPHNNLVGSIGIVFCFLGLLIAIWSRYRLGKNWSLSVQKKEDHELVSTGMYRYVRHPIYTGLIALFFGNALIVGDWRGLIAVAIVIVSLWFKLRKEEKWLIEVFGDRYIEYRKNTKAIIPWLL